MLLTTGIVTLIVVTAGLGPTYAQSVTGDNVSPAPDGSTDWAVGGNLTVGGSSAGSLTILGGGKVTNELGYIANNINGNGLVTVSGYNGVASTWINNQTLTVGSRGVGKLEIDGGGQVESAWGYVGRSGGTGTVTVSGSDGNGHLSTWTSTNALYVGNGGAGVLNIEAGGVVQNTQGTIGLNSTGMVTVSGTDGGDNVSTWDMIDSANVWHNLDVGSSGTGTLIIEGGGWVGSGQGRLGVGAGAVGSVTVSGGDGGDHASTWENSSLYLGDNGTGTLTIEDGGVVNTTGYGYVGYQDSGDPNAGIAGTATVSGAGSAWSSSNLIVGTVAMGILQIENGGAVTSGSFVVGQTATGTVLIGDGGAADTANATIGRDLGSSGSVIVTGSDGAAASTWTNSGSLVVGAAGTGFLYVEDGAKLSSTLGYVGDSIDGVGTIEISGHDGTNASTWVNAGDLFVGYDGTGTLTIENGGVLNNDGEASLGRGTGEGRATVSGGNGHTSTWTNTGDLYIGRAGTGTLEILGGGVVEVEGDIRIGAQMGGDGTLNLSGNDADGRGILEAGSIVRGYGTAILNLNGGILRANRDEDDFLVDFTTLTVGSEGAWFDSNAFDIGVETEITGSGGLHKQGTGTLTLTGENDYTGETVIGAGTLQLGDGGTTGSIASAVITDNGALAFNRSDNALIIDSVISGTGALVQAGLGKTTLAGTNTYAGGTTISAGTLQIGDGGTAGSITGNVTDNATLIFDRSNAAEFNGKISGSGALIKNGGGILTLTADNNYHGSTTVNAGTLRINGDQSAATGTVDIAAAGTLGGSGTIGGDVNVIGGTLAPGNSPGTLTIKGNLVMDAAARLDYEFGEAYVPGGTFNDLVNVGGDLTLDGTLSITASPGRTFGPGVYRVFNYDGTLAGPGLTLAVADPELYVQTSIDHQVNLVNTAGQTLNFWDGAAGPGSDGVVQGGDGTWQLAGTADNWTEMTGLANTPYKDGAFAVFGAAAGTVSVDNGNGDVTASGMQFGSDGYLVEGDVLTLVGGAARINVGDGSTGGAGYVATIASELTGASQLVKGDLGTLVLTGANTYTGGTALNGGTVRISSNANLGDADGGLSFDGGTLQTTTSLVLDRAVTLTGAGAFLTDAGTIATLDGDITGPGSLTKAGAGSLVLVGDASHLGGTTISDGILRIGNGGASGNLNGNVVDNAVLAFNRAGSALAAGNISGSGSLAQIGSGTTILTGTNTYGGGTMISAGALQVGNGGTAGSITGDVLDNGLLAFDRSDRLIFDGVISGTGALAQTGSGKTVLTAISSLSGGTDVFSGALAVDGSIASSAVLVHDGAMLTGKGAVGQTTLVSGGTIAPGNGIGTLTVNGNYAQQAGAIYQAEVNPTSTSADKLAVNGEAILEDGAILQVVKNPVAPYVAGTRYTVLTATNGLRGTFDLNGEIDLTAFISLTDEYDANNAYLVTKQRRSIISIGGSPNQGGVGGSVDDLPASNPVHTGVINQPDVDSAHDALDQLSGEIHASTQAASLENSDLLRGAVTDVLRGTFCSVGAEPEKRRNATGSPGASDCAIASDRPKVWSQAIGSWGHTHGNDNVAAMDRSTSGLLIGGDATLFDSWRVGAFAGFGQGIIDIDKRNSSATVGEYYAGIYGGTQWGNLSLRAGATNTWQSIATSRHVSLPGLDNDLSASYDARVSQVFGDVGYRIDVDQIALEPFASLAYVSLDTDGFREQGGAAALTGAGGTMDTVFTTIGLRASMAFDLDGVAMVARGSLGWRHALVNTTPQSRLAFAGASPFTIAGSPIDEDAILVSAGIDLALSPNANLGLSYGGQFSGDTTDQALKGTFAIAF
ncbi:MAG TPA: autotransporter domain-containing protein [Devosiaceae bacterium]